MRHDSDSDTPINRVSINRQRHDSDSDLSPCPRRVEKSPEFSNSNSRNRAEEGEQPFKRHISPSILVRQKKSHARNHRLSESDSDLSPERVNINKSRYQAHDKISRLSKEGHQSDSDLSPERLDNRDGMSWQIV